MKISVIKNSIVLRVLGLSLSLFVFMSNAFAGDSFYWMDTWMRTPTGFPSYVCTGDYPSKVGALCFKEEKCSSRKGAGKNWGYNFDGATTCWRKKDCIGCDVPKSYPAPSRAMSSQCSGDKVTIAGACYNQCPSGMIGATPLCTSKIPPKYVQCGAGYANSTTACAQILADQTLSGTAFAAAISGNFVAAKGGIAAKVGKRLAKLPAKAAGDMLAAMPKTVKFALKYSDDFLSIAKNVSKVGDAKSAQRMAIVFESAFRYLMADADLKKIAGYGGFSSIPSILTKATSGNITAADTGELLSFVRNFSGFMSMMIAMSLPAPGPTDNVATMLDLISVYAYNVYPG